MSVIYVLKLINNKYYIGRTNDISRRIGQHLEGKGSFWTKKYTPISLIKVYENISIFDEDKITKEYMNKFGIDNVRGGSYSQEIISEKDYKTIQKEIWHATNCCLRCGRNNHYIKDCFAEFDINNHYIDDNLFERIINFSNNIIKGLKLFHNENIECSRCGRKSHTSNNCYAKTHIKGYSI